jgi:hypothetical protein
MVPRDLWIAIDDKDAMIVIMAVSGLHPTDEDGLYEFSGDRTKLDEWVTAYYPQIAYTWIDRCHICFTDKAAKASLDVQLGSRLIDATPIP